MIFLAETEISYTKLKKLKISYTKLKMEWFVCFSFFSCIFFPYFHQTACTCPAIFRLVRWRINCSKLGFSFCFGQWWFHLFVIPTKSWLTNTVFATRMPCLQVPYSSSYVFGRRLETMKTTYVMFLIDFLWQTKLKNHVKCQETDSFQDFTH